MSERKKGPPLIWPPSAWEAQEPLRDGLESGDRLLYHYTTPHAFTEIVRREIIWAGDVRRSNDASELKYALDLLRNELNLLERPQGGPPGHPPAGALFASCLSELEDDLGQWRAYCPPFGGFAIGVSLKDMLEGLRASKKEEGADVGSTAVCLKCVYGPTQHRQLVAQTAEHLEALAGETLLFHALTQLSFIKHPSFESEQEWRLVFPVHGLAAGDVKHRATRTGIVQYVELPFKRTAIRRVVIGPAPESAQELNAESVASLFAEISGWVFAPCPEIVLSKVPHQVS